MIESPVIQELVAETRHRDILRFLSGRFGLIPQDTAAALRSVQDEAKLDELVDWASRCPNLDEFRTRLAS